METRNVALTLDKAKEWFNSDCASLKEVALQAFTEEELTKESFEDIKTFEDACNALTLFRSDVHLDIERFEVAEGNLGTQMVAQFKLAIIKRALNGEGWKPKMTEGSIYYPYVRFYPADKAKEAAKSNDWKVCESFKADGKKYSLVGGGYSYCCDGGLGNFGYGYGSAYAALGLLGCKSKEIAIHMSKYFAKEIFEACYSQYENYTWL